LLQSIANIPTWFYGGVCIVCWNLLLDDKKVKYELLAGESPGMRRELLIGVEQRDTKKCREWTSFWGNYWACAMKLLGSCQTTWFVTAK
jgi:hypothetical protein